MDLRAFLASIWFDLQEWKSLSFDDQIKCVHGGGVVIKKDRVSGQMWDGENLGVFRAKNA